MLSDKIEFEAIPNRPGLYKYDLVPPVECYPGQWHLVKWDICKRKQECEETPQQPPILGSMRKDTVGAKILVYMYQAYMACPEDKGDELVWIGVSKTRLIQDNAITDKPMSEEILLIVIDRLREEGFLAVAKGDEGEILFPTRAMIMAIIQGRVHPQKMAGGYLKAKKAAEAAT